MKDSRAKRLLRSAARGALGLAPTVGIVGVAVWMLIAGAREEPEAARMPLIQVILRNPLTWLAAAQSLWFVLQAILWVRYRQFVAHRDTPLPSLSVIIPAYNEGPMIERSCRSVAKSDYPAALLEIILVDDGSRDDTYFHMERLRREFPDRVRLIRFAGNRGKKAALEAGFTAARGEVVATLDSDSEIDEGTLRALVAPLQLDERIGAVAGRVAVVNRDGLIGRMLDVQYALSFDFGRAAQSAYRTVACCPGALSAFRRDLILPHMPEWLDQQFLGRPVSHGEDQALTNIVLRAGYDTVYQRDAVVHTVVPQRYRQLCRMFTRWDRSFVVEGFSFARFMFTDYRKQNRVLPALSFTLVNLRLVLLYVGIAQLPWMVIQHPALLAQYMVAFMIGSAFAALYYLRTERSIRFVYGIAYAFYSLFLLQWVFPWAVVTVRDERWGTR